ncbi:hypothetical protein AMTRI_Chr09g36460 [Amborella trichopoda]
MAPFATVVAFDVSSGSPWLPVCISVASSSPPLLEDLSPSIGLDSIFCLLLCEEHLLFAFHRFASHLSGQFDCVCHPLMADMNPLYSHLSPLMMIHLILVSLI